MSISSTIGCMLAISCIRFVLVYRDSVVQVSFAPLAQIFHRVILQVSFADVAFPAGEVAPVHSRAMVVLCLAIPDEEPPPFLQPCTLC